LEYAFSTPRTLLRGLEREDCKVIADFYNNRELLEGFLFPYEPVFPATKAELEGWWTTSNRGIGLPFAWSIERHTNP